MPNQNSINNINIVSSIVGNDSGSGTYTPPVNLLYAIVILRGGGGAGGGSSTGNTIGLFSAGAGGGAGGYAIGVYSRAQLLPNVVVTVGAGGTGVSAGTGNAGGASTFGSLLTANGGSGGQYLLGLSTVQITKGGAGGTYSGTGATGAAGTSGGHGLSGDFSSFQIAARGIGGSQWITGGNFTNFSIPGTGAANQDNGAGASGRGGGGTGAFTVNAGNDATGGNGEQGVFNIIEFLGA